MADIKKLSFHGTGRIRVSDWCIQSSTDIDVVKDPKTGEYVITGEKTADTPAPVTGIFNDLSNYTSPSYFHGNVINSFNVNGAQYTSSGIVVPPQNSNVTRVNHNGTIVDISDNGMDINGLHYTPYKPIKGRWRNMQVYLPVGISMYEDGSISDSRSDEKDTTHKQKTKEFKYTDRSPLLSEIKIYGDVDVLIEKGVKLDTNLTINVGGKGSLSFEETAIITGTALISTFDNGSFNGRVHANNVFAWAIDHSNLSGVQCNQSGKVTASGESTCVITASQSAKITKEKNGQATCTVIRFAQ